MLRKYSSRLSRLAIELRSIVEAAFFAVLSEREIGYGKTWAWRRFHPAHHRQRFHKLLKEADLPNIRFHDLRHSAATILLSMGVHPKVVQEILGHSQIAVTMDTYSHVLPSMQMEAMNKLGDLFQRGNQDVFDCPIVDPLPTNADRNSDRPPKNC